MKIHDTESINVVPGALHCIDLFLGTSFFFSSFFLSSFLAFPDRCRGRYLEAVLSESGCGCLHVV